MDDRLYPGKSLAIASVICGIISCVLVVVSYFARQSYKPNFYLAIPAVFCGFCGIILAHCAAKKGNNGDLPIAGTILSWVGAVFAAILCGYLIHSLNLLSRFS